MFTADTGASGIRSTAASWSRIVQAVARECLGAHVGMDRLGWRNLFTVHDETVLEVDQTVTARDVEPEMSHCPEWLKGCPIAAEAKEVAHYLK